MEKIPEDVKTINDAIDYMATHGLQPVRYRFAGNPWEHYTAAVPEEAITEIEFSDRSRFHRDGTYTAPVISHRHTNINV